MSDNETAPKRLRSASISKSNGPSSASDMSVAELANLMKSQLESYRRSTKEDIKQLGQTLSSQIDKLKLDIAVDLEKLREDNKVTFNELTASIEETKVNTTHALERTNRSNDLIVSGVPFVQGENLTSYYNAWCHSLGYDQNNFPLVDIRRLVKGVPAVGNVYIILLQFAITIQRNDFYAAYLRTRSLMLSDIGFAVKKRIYINENLGPATRTLRTKALQLKKDGIFSGVYSKNGIVHVKKTSNDREFAVTSENDLRLFVQTKPYPS